MTKTNLLTGAIATMVGATAAVAGVPTPIFDNIGGPNDGMGFSTNVLDQQWVYDDLNVAGGGLLAGFSFAYGTEAFQGFAEGDAEVELYLDDGAMSPGTLDKNEDTLLVAESFQNLSATAGAFGAIIFERQDVIYQNPSVVIPDGATVWGAMKYTRIVGGNLHGVYFAPVSIGSTDQFTYDDNNPPFDLSSFGYPQDTGIGWELYVIPEPASLTLLALGGVGLLSRRRR